MIKPEYLEWQVFFSGFYTEQNRGDNTLENAEFYSKPKTHSSIIKQNQEAYDRMEAELRNTGLLSAAQLAGIMGGYYNIINELRVEDQEIIRNILDNGLKYITKIEGFKSYQSPQKPKEIDLGINITPKVINRNPLNPAPSIPAEPNIKLPDFTPDIPTAPTVPALAIKAFNPVSPVINAPVLFTPPSLTYTAGGFGQTYYTISQNEGGQGFMLGNYETIDATTPIIINASNTVTSYTGSLNVDGSINPRGSLGGAVVTGTLNGGSYNSIMNAYYSMVGNFDTTMTGDYTVTNTRSDGRSTIFISYNPYEVNTTAKTVKFDGKVTLNNSMNGGQNVLVGVEHQLLGCNNGGSFSCSTNIGNAPSIFENAAGSQIILNSGINMIGIMIDSEGTQLTQRSKQ